MINRPDKTGNNECENLHFDLPCELAERVRDYAEKNDVSITNVLIEALDAFLRSQVT
jgi:hypothetical protein